MLLPDTALIPLPPPPLNHNIVPTDLWNSACRSELEPNSNRRAHGEILELSENNHSPKFPQNFKMQKYHSVKMSKWQNVKLSILSFFVTGHTF